MDENASTEQDELRFISRFETSQTSYSLLESYYGTEESRTALVAEIQERIRLETQDNHISETLPGRIPARKRFLLPLFLIPLLILAILGSYLATRHFFSSSVQALERAAVEYGNTEGYILDILRRESEKNLDRSDAAVSTYLRELDEIEARRVLLVSEFAYSLIQKAADLEAELGTRFTEGRTALAEQYGEDSADFQEALATQQSVFLGERSLQYERFRRIRLALFEKELGEILDRRQELEQEVTREFMAASASEAAKMSGHPQPRLEVPATPSIRPLFSLPLALREALDMGLESEATAQLEQALTEIYPDNADYRAIQRMVQLASERAAAEAALKAESATGQSLRSDIKDRVSAFLANLEAEPLLSDRRIVELADRFGGSEPIVSAVLVSIAHALRAAGSNSLTGGLVFLGNISIFAGDRIVVELSGEASPDPGAQIVVRRRTPDGGEIPIASGSVIAIFGISVEARIEELYDAQLRPTLMDRVYVNVR